MTHFVSVLALVLAVSAPAVAQVDRATLAGVVRDPSNAVVPQAGVAVTHLATGVTSRPAASSRSRRPSC
jgi:hypothetical protein